MEKSVDGARIEEWLNGQTNSLLAIKILTIFNRFYNLHFKLCLHTRARTSTGTRSRLCTIQTAFGGVVINRSGSDSCGH